MKDDSLCEGRFRWETAKMYDLLGGEEFLGL